MEVYFILTAAAVAVVVAVDVGVAVVVVGADFVGAFATRGAVG